MWCGEIQSVPFKRTGKNPLTYLEKAEIDALLASPDPPPSRVGKITRSCSSYTTLARGRARRQG